MKRMNRLLLAALIMTVTAGSPVNVFAAESTGSVTAESQQTNAADKTVILTWEDQQGVAITDSIFDKYFIGNNAKSGITELLNEGQVYMNGAALPYMQGDGTYSTTDYQKNKQDALWQEKDGSWSYYAHIYWNGKNMKFEDARMAFLEGISQIRGQTMEFHDDNGDGKTDRITTTFYDSALISRVEKSADGNTVSLYGMEDGAAKGDAIAFTSTVPAVFPADSVDSAITAGSMVMYWYDAQSGWQIQRAVPHYGKLVESSYNIKEPYWKEEGTSGLVLSTDTLSDKSYIPEAFRHTQFIRAYRRTDQYDNDSDIIMWTTPTGYAFGFTYGDNAYNALAYAFNFTQQQVFNVKVSLNGSDIAPTQYWVKPDIFTAYTDALTKTYTMLQSKNASDLEAATMLYDLGNVYGGTEDLNSTSPFKMNPYGVIGSIQMGSGK